MDNKEEGTRKMATYTIVKEVSLSMSIAVEAPDENAAMNKLSDAWANDEDFAVNYVMKAAVVDASLYPDPTNPNADYTLEELL